MDAKDRIFVAADVASRGEYINLLRLARGKLRVVKIGMEVLTAVGARDAILLARSAGLHVMHDGKWADIPETLERATKALAAHQNVAYVTVHASNMTAESYKRVNGAKAHMKVLAVTVLTSLGEEDAQFSFRSTVKASVLRFVDRALANGADGIVCSAREARMLRARFGNDFLIVTPAIRPAWAVKADDQKRITTPTQAFEDGADFVVVGRPIVRPPDEIGGSAKAIELIASEIDVVLQRPRATARDHLLATLRRGSYPPSR